MQRRLIDRRSQAGLTLIELLVVTVILGLLSAVVVFAVRGAGDKGDANARATDKRILQTALQAFCAQKGHFPGSGDDGWPDAQNVLVKQRFLSSRSVYNDIAVSNGGGLCGGTAYDIIDLAAGTTLGPPFTPYGNGPNDSYCIGSSVSDDSSCTHGVYNDSSGLIKGSGSTSSGLGPSGWQANYSSRVGATDVLRSSANKSVTYRAMIHLNRAESTVNLTRLPRCQAACLLVSTSVLDIRVWHDSCDCVAEQSLLLTDASIRGPPDTPASQVRSNENISLSIQLTNPSGANLPPGAVSIMISADGESAHNTYLSPGVEATTLSSLDAKVTRLVRL